MNTTKSIVPYAVVLSLVLLFTALSTPGQDKRETITVKGVEANKDVVIITALTEKTPIELQCNKGFFACTALKPGDYVMVRLPKNHGIYDCSNVEVYEKSAAPVANGPGLGRYCITEK